MKYVLFDVESTGLTSKDEVIQFSALIFDNPEFRILKELVDFYCFTTIPIKKDAEKVHGISPANLLKWSNKKFFEEQFIPLVERLGPDVTWVNYSNTMFDLRLINQTLQNANLEPMNFGTRVYDFSETEGIHHLDLMTMMANKLNGNSRAISLSNALKKTPGFNQQTLDIIYSNMNKKLESSCPENKELQKRYHCARYDAFAMWYLLAKNT